MEGVERGALKRWKNRKREMGGVRWSEWKTK